MTGTATKQDLGDGGMTGMGRHEPFSVTSEQRSHTAHLRLFGEIDLAATPVLEEWLHTAESNGNTAIVVDLEEVTFMDASGLRAFLGAAERAVQSGRTFEITGAPAVVQRVLRITGTTHLLAKSALVPTLRSVPDPLALPLAEAAVGLQASGAEYDRDGAARRD